MALYKLLQGKYSKVTDKGFKTFRAGVKGENILDLDSREIESLGDRVEKITAAAAKKELSFTVNPKSEGLKQDEGGTDDDTETDDDKLPE